MQQAFDKMHVLMAADALAAYPDHNKRFDIYTDASDFKLCAGEYKKADMWPNSLTSCQKPNSTIQ